MDSKERVEPAEAAEEAEPADAAAATLVGTNILGMNAGSYPGGIAGPAAEIAAAESADESDPGLRLSDLTGGVGGKRATGDEGVSAPQRELEAGELNG